jgi:hypothetical protein
MELGQRASGRRSARGGIVAVTTEPTSIDAERPGSVPTRAWPVRLVGAGLVALTVSPIVVGAVSLIGDSWVPLSDWASLLHRVSEVGTRDTPLVGPYSFHGWAHPGPLLYWITAPLYRLTGGDPRSLLWTGALVNTAAVVAIAAVAWRRGRWPVLLGVLAFVALLVHAFRPEVVLDVWNPYVPLLPFVLTILLVWEAAVGTRRALVEAALPATFAVQSHLAFLSLAMLLGVWLFAWNRWSPGLVPGAERAPRVSPPVATVRRATVLVGVLWLAPLLDALFDLHNPLNVAKSMLHPGSTVGPVNATAVVGSYVGVDGAWLTGGDRAVHLTPDRVDALWLVGVIALLTGCLAVARRRRLVDAAALASLALTLLIGSVPATSRLIAPTMPYLTEWLKIVGALAWFTVAWTAWRLVDTSASTQVRQRTVAAGLASALLLAGVAASWGAAATTEPPHGDDAALVQEIRAALVDELARDETYRVEVVGDPFSYYDGLVYWMIRDGHDIVTSDGAAGLKWGRDHRWAEGDDHDASITVAVHQPWSESSPYDDCFRDPGVQQVVSYDGLSPDERSWLADVNLRRLGDPTSITAAEGERAARLGRRDRRVAVFVGSRGCGD